MSAEGSLQSLYCSDCNLIWKRGLCKYNSVKDLRKGHPGSSSQSLNPLWWEARREGDVAGGWGSHRQVLPGGLLPEPWQNLGLPAPHLQTTGLQNWEATLLLFKPPSLWPHTYGCTRS